MNKNTKAFDNKKYINKQIQAIKKKVEKFDKTYLEIGGHLVNDTHASRVLCNYNKNNKLKILDNIKKDIEMYYCIFYKHLIKDFPDHNSKKYRKEILKEIKFLKNKYNLKGIVITRFTKNNEIIDHFIRKIKKQDLNLYKTKIIKDYPNNIDIILGKKGYENQPYIKTNKKIIIITSKESNSGKMSLCLSQIYHDSKNNINSGYVKFESFPIWNLNIDHPINLAYEAATADLQDKNQIDLYHLKEYNIKSVNYNRDIENFKILKKIISKITKKNNYMKNYKSPTDMGINTLKLAINNNEKVKKCSKKEINRRYKIYKKKYLKNRSKKNLKTLNRIKEIKSKIKE